MTRKECAMRTVVSLVLVGTIVVGCFGKPATTAASAPSAPEKKEDTKVPSSMVTAAPVQEAKIKSTPTPVPDGSSVATSSEQVPVVTQDPSMAITDVRVGDPALESAIQFSVDRAGTVAIHPQSTEGLRLFKVRDDQFGQTELVADLPASTEVSASLPTAGTFRVAGKERLPSFMDVPLGGDMPQTQYRVQWLSGCPAIPIPEKKLEWGGYTSPRAGKLTLDTEYPAKVTVYVHRGAGNSDDPRDSFQNWVDYNRSSSPNMAALNERVRAYVPAPWDSGPAPGVAANDYNNNRTPCGVAGESWVDVCHSAGCLKVWRAMLEDPKEYEGNNRGIIGVASVLGGSHWAIKDLTDASLAMNYEEKAAHWASVRTLVQWEWGMLLPQSRLKIFLKDLLAGSRFTPYNEGARSLAWNGVGAGIPTMAYKWYSNIFFDRGRYLSRLLSPNSRFTMPEASDLGNLAPNKYTWVGESTPTFNYIEAMGALTSLRREPVADEKWWSFGSEWALGKMDVAVCYLNDSTSSQQVKIAQFEKEYGEESKLELAWRNKTEAGFHRKFAKAALPWMNAVIAKAPSIAPNDPNPNESAVNDGALTFCQQLGCKDGPSILAPGSKYGALIINRGAAESRKPQLVDAWKDFPGRDHLEAVEGDLELWDWMNTRLIARVDKLREEEKTHILTDKEKRKILDMLGPRGGDTNEPTEWDGTRHLKVTNYVLYASPVKWTQDPLNTGQRNRVRVVGKGKLATYVGWWSSIYNAYDYDPKQWDDSKYAAWDVDEQFVIRNGEPWLVAN
ncbi:hypothetical protein HY623_02840 [Candidatus Uhrbacteria bacterium]|nr:hypothetical protein [Candidatus Uhrbacteria bacterium]